MKNRQQVAGIGGVFFKARDPKALAAWYREHLGVPVFEGTTYASFEAGSDGRDGTGEQLVTAWSTFAATTDYFGPGPSSCMVNYRVADVDAMLEQLRGEGVETVGEVQDSEFGKFGCAVYPEGNRFELWQPPSRESKPE